jgi:hypothetical protein
MRWAPAGRFRKEARPTFSLKKEGIRPYLAAERQASLQGGEPRPRALLMGRRACIT